MYDVLEAEIPRIGRTHYVRPIRGISASSSRQYRYLVHDPFAVRRAALGTPLQPVQHVGQVGGSGGRGDPAGGSGPRRCGGGSSQTEERVLLRPGVVREHLDSAVHRRFTQLSRVGPQLSRVRL